MVKLSLDTNRDAVEDLQEALEILEEAITRRKAAAALTQDAPKAAAPAEETALETPFFKITVESEEQVPTLNDLLSKESITETELTEMFKAQGQEKPKRKKPREESSEDAFIEIVDFDDEER